MKTTLSIENVFLRFATRKRPVIAGGIVLCLSLVGATTYAYYAHHNTGSVTPLKTTEQAPEQPASAVTVSPRPVESETPPTQSSTPISEPEPKSKLQAQPSTTSAPQPSSSKPAPVTQQIPIFTAGRLMGAGVMCYTGTYAYSVGSTTISVNTRTTDSFSWQIELSDGTIHRQERSSMYNGGTVWSDFPSTPGFPSQLGTIYNPQDGLKARLVITAPNYSAGGWSDPVPIGSSTSCPASPDYQGV